MLDFSLGLFQIGYRLREEVILGHTLEYLQTSLYMTVVLL